MALLDDLPAPAVRLITRYARTRNIRGTNTFARVCRSWRDAVLDSEDQEQLQLLLALEGLPADAVTSTSAWLVQHGQCVNSLCIAYEDDTAPVFQQLPLSTAPLVGLVRLEVDGPDSLVALASALPQLVALTHLRASIEIVRLGDSVHERSQGVFSAQWLPLEAPPSLQQLCPGLKSLRLSIVRVDSGMLWHVEVPVAQLLPDHLQQLHVNSAPSATMYMPCDTLSSFTSLHRLVLTSPCMLDLDLLLDMLGLEELDLRSVHCCVDGGAVSFEEWLTHQLFTAPHRLTKITGLSITHWEPAPFISDAFVMALSRLRKLEVALWKDSAAAGVKQLSTLRCLQHLSLPVYCKTTSEATAVVSALSSVQQLTSLHLHGSDVDCSMWATVLPHLTQLRVLGPTMELLLGGGLVEEVTRLSQLQCLYVDDCRPGRWWDPVNLSAEMAPSLDMLSKCSSLRAVLYWSHTWVGDSTAPPLWYQLYQGRLHLSCWHKWRQAAVEGRVVCPAPCPHLPGVWELEQQQPADGT
jgi:hypothetical protein